MGDEGGANSSELLAFGFVDVRKGKIQFVQGFEDGAGDDEAREPFVVRGNDVPRSVFGGGLLDHFLVGFLVVLPEAALVYIGHGKLPILFGVLEAFEKALLLFFLGDVEKEFSDDHPVACEVALEGVDASHLTASPRAKSFA